MEDIRYPIGTFQHNSEIDAAQREAWIGDIASLPSQLRDAVTGLTQEQLSTPYRDGGWSVRQVIHHVADSHMNAYIRFKLALTEDNPSIKPYYEDRWAELHDTEAEPVETSLALLDALHRRWGTLLQGMSEEDYQRTFFHPEQQKSMRLDLNLGMYAWHGRHHLAHIKSLKQHEKHDRIS
ncbi:YfiT family bacillithiol transferase [Paenibacillus paeoniae]|uniref:Putative metal-dependent hydrolase DX130_08300 n=1 Tax=Paenibacillus paeoniae TaxID=2292705 RepID=A0A371PMI6_9BACL|nr:putative metal-dependent hydrolase [Paenibacillus paeoniae]REK76997.1 putative metal-dependent hydrolase [Paenibacillus paeoniae]